MDYLDQFENVINIDTIEIQDDFIHQSSEHGKKLFEMIMKSNELLKRHYDLLNTNEEVMNYWKNKFF